LPILLAGKKSGKLGDQESAGKSGKGSASSANGGKAAAAIATRVRREEPA